MMMTAMSSLDTTNGTSEQDTSAAALQDVEIMSADTSTTDLGGSGERGSSETHPGITTPTPLPRTGPNASIYEFEEKDDDDEDGLVTGSHGELSNSMPTDLLLKTQYRYQQHLNNSKCYEKPKQRWLQKDLQLARSDDDVRSFDNHYPGGHISGSEASGSIYCYSDSNQLSSGKKAKKRKHPNGDRSRSSTGGGIGGSESYDRSSNCSVIQIHQIDSDSACDDDYPSAPIPIKLKICRDPSTAGVYRVVPPNLSSNGLVHVNTPGKQARKVDSCYMSDNRQLRCGDIVWAKITGYPYWPSRIFEIIEERRSNSTPSYSARVDWFAWNQCSYIPCHKLITFLDHLESKFDKKSKNRSYIEAVDEAKRCAEQRLLNDIMNSQKIHANGVNTSSTTGPGRGASHTRSRGVNSRISDTNSQPNSGTKRCRNQGVTKKVAKPKQARGRPRGSTNRRVPSSTSISDPSVEVIVPPPSSQPPDNAKVMFQPECNGVGDLPLANGLDPFHGVETGVDMPWQIHPPPEAIIETPGGLLPELPDLGQLGFGDAMKCHVPSFSSDDEDDEEDPSTFVQIDPDCL